MSFIQRNRNGEISGVYSNKQDGYAEEFLPDDNPDVIAFNIKHALPDFPMQSKEEMDRFNAEREAIQQEISQLEKNILSHLRSRSSIETAMSALLHQILIGEGHSQVAYAIYFSSTSLTGRITLVSDVLNKIFEENVKPPTEENKALSKLKPLWKKIREELKRSIESSRNKVAHGSILEIRKAEKTYVRIISSAFDVKRNDPSQGLSLEELKTANDNLYVLEECINDAHRAFEAFSAKAPTEIQKLAESIQKRLAPLES